MGNRKKISVEVGSVLVFGLGVFTVVALMSYHAADSSFFSSGGDVPHNFCGRVGAYLAAAILNGFGLGAFLVPAALFFVSATIHKNEGGVKAFGIIGGMTVAVSSLTVFLALQWKYWNYGGAVLLTGGILGTWVANGLQQQLNSFGSSLVALMIFALSLVIATPVSVAQTGGRVIHVSSMVIYRFMKWLASYSLYLLSLVLMKVALWANQSFRKMRESLSLKMQVNPSQSGTLLASPALPFPPDKENEPVFDLDTEQGGDSGQNKNLDLEKKKSQNDLELEDLCLDEDADLSDVAPKGKKGKEIKILPREVDTALAAGAKAPKSATKARRGQWQLPTVEFLKKPPVVESAVDRSKLIANSQILKQKFADFGIDGEVTAVRPGPVITLYEFKPGPGVKVSRIAALADDLSMALSAQSVRILAPLPGKSVVGIEIPSDTRETVYLREFLQHPDFYGSKHMIPVVMGKDIGGQTYLSDLARMPHLLCAGQTGSGKSVFMNGLICSLFYRFTPDELRMILVDPKFIEFRAYQDIPHLLLPVVDDPKHASIALKWAVREMERRYRILAKIGARNLASFNQKVDEMGADVVKDLLFAEDGTEVTSSMSGADWVEAFEPDENGAPRINKLPCIVVIIDELADLMMIAKKEVEISIARIAQKARAAGIHLIIATQRPSTDVVTGLIKANLPSRVSFQLASYVDSKTILDRAGAERLLGQGDMLFVPPGVSQSLRLHGAYLDDDEIGKITSFLKSQGKPAYRDEILLSDDEDEEEGGGSGDDADDELFSEAMELVKRSGHASASYLQRNLKVGYNRAARMIETMEARGIVGPQDGARPREVLIR